MKNNPKLNNALQAIVLIFIIYSVYMNGWNTWNIVLTVMFLISFALNLFTRYLMYKQGKMQASQEAQKQGKHKRKDK